MPNLYSHSRKHSQTRLLAPKSKRHRLPNLESQTPNMITFSKIEERVKEQYHCWIIGKSLCVNLCASWQGRLANMPNLYSHSRKHSQTRLLAPKSKRHRPPNLESQTPNMITFSKIEERVKEQYHCWIIGKSLCVNLCASWQGRLANMPNLYSHSRKHSQQDCLLQNRRGTALRISRARLPT
ncbi:hypothetical protein ACFXTO_002573 [Malus domestica]